MTGHVQLICDYASGDLAWAEILAALSDELPSDVRFVQTSVASFDTIATGFIVAQLGGKTCKSGNHTILFANCAPRKDKSAARKDNEGEGLVYVKLVNGAELLVVNSGYSLSFVKPLIKDFHATKASDKGSQFRSRDNFPGVLAKCLTSVYDFLGDKLDVSIIPDPPSQVVAYVDSFGNIKTSIRKGDKCLANLKEGDRVRIVVGDKIRYATVTNGSFSVPEGDLAFAPGSSGYDKPFWELFKRGGSAWLEFGKPASCTHVEIQPAA
jgi:hypothetical protein